MSGTTPAAGGAPQPSMRSDGTVGQRHEDAFGPGHGADQAGTTRRSGGHARFWLGAAVVATLVAQVALALLLLGGRSDGWSVIGTRRGLDGPSDEATFDYPVGLVVAGNGEVYVADPGGGTIRKIDTDGNVTTYAGTPGEYGDRDGPADQATFVSPLGLDLDDDGNLYVADAGTSTIRKIDTDGNVTTYAGTGVSGRRDGPADQATFGSPWSVAVHDDMLYVADLGNDTIRKIDTDGNVTTYAGTGTYGLRNGPADEAAFSSPSDIVADDDGNLYLTDLGSNTIRKIDTDGNVTTYAGTSAYGDRDGPADQATFAGPADLAIDGRGDLLVTDTSGVRRVTADGEVSTVVKASIWTNDPDLLIERPNAIAVDEHGTMFITDSDPGVVRVVSDDGGQRSIGVPRNRDGSATEATFRSPRGPVVGPGGDLFVADTAIGSVRRIASDGTVTTYASPELDPKQPLDGADAWWPTDIAIDAVGNVYVADPGSQLIRVIDDAGQVSTFAGSGATGGLDGPADRAAFDGPTNLVVDGVGNLYVAESWGASRIRRIDPDGNVTTVAGRDTAGSADGPAETATFAFPAGMAVDGDDLFVADTGNHTIRRIDADGNVSTFAGTGVAGDRDGAAERAMFDQPTDVAVADDGTLYVADRGNGAVRAIEPDGTVSTFATRSDGLVEPAGVWVDGDVLIVTDDAGLVVRFELG